MNFKRIGSRVFGMSVSNLEFVDMLEHVPDAQRFGTGQLLEVVSLDRHLAFANRLCERNHAI